MKMTKQELIMMLRYDIKNQRLQSSSDRVFFNLNGITFYLESGLKINFEKWGFCLRFGRKPIAHMTYNSIVSVGYTFSDEDEVRRAIDFIHVTGSLDGYEPFNLQWGCSANDR